MKFKTITAFLLSCTLLCSAFLSVSASGKQSLSDVISKKSVSQGLSIGDYSSLKSMLPDLSSTFHTMSQSDLNAQMSVYMQDIQGKYKSALNSAQSKAGSSYSSSAAGIQSRADQIKKGINPDTGESYNNYIANNMKTYDFNQYMNDTSSSMQSSLQNAMSLAGTPANNDSAYQSAMSNFKNSYSDSLGKEAATLSDYDTLFDNYSAINSDGKITNGSGLKSVGQWVYDQTTIHAGGDLTDEARAALNGY